MNQKGFSLPQIVALIFIVFVIFIIYFSIKSFFNKEKISYLEYEESDKPVITLNGGYVEYVQMNVDYVDKGATAVSKSGQNLSNKITKKIYLNDRVTTKIDTSKLNTYKIEYTVTDPNDNYLTTIVSRVVIVIDTTSPKITLPTTKTIKVNEVAGYDLEEGVVVSDNSGYAKLTYDNTLKPVKGEYIITYKATDSSGNKVTKKRLIKVTD